MKIRITNIEADLRDGVMQPSGASFHVVECGYNFGLRIDEGRNLYVCNRGPRTYTKKGKCDLFKPDPLMLTLEDLPVF